MPLRPSRFIQQALVMAVGLLIVKVTASVVLRYGDYFPPNFDSEFLHGREGYFAGAYAAAFYAHIVSGPLALLLGLLLVSEQFRNRLPKWHRQLGRMQAVSVLLLLTPSGLWMATRAATGPIAAASFATLAIATAACVAMGWRRAVQRRFTEHRRWMGRCFVLLCSAVVLRLMGGVAVVAGIDAAWFDPAAAWACWVLPLVVLEVCFRTTAGRASPQRPPDLNQEHYSSSAATLSLPAIEIQARSEFGEIVGGSNRTEASASST